MIQSQSLHFDLRKFVAPEYVFGMGARKLAANYCKKLSAEKVFITTDAGIRNTPWLQELEDSLSEEGIHYVIFDSISPNPRDFEVMNGTQYFIENKCNIILAIGGGSVIDCAKGIGIVASNYNKIQHFEGIDKIEKPTPPLICIPTTSGSSADVSQFAIINNYSEKYKMAIISKTLVPDIALIDPVVLQTMDEYLTACTGLDALSHAIEAYVSNASSAFTDLFALEAIQILDKSLRINHQNPSDMEARGRTMLASLYAGLAFSNASLGSIHAMSHSLGGYLDLAHGECNAILLPHVVDYNYSSAAPKYKTITEKVGISTAGLSDKEIKHSLINYLFDLRSQLGITATLSKKGVTSDIIFALSEKAIKDPCNATNPRAPIAEDLSAIYKEAL